MPAGIFENMGMYARKPAWHGLGTVFEDPVTAEQAVTRTGADFRFFLAEVDAKIETDFGTVRLPLGDQRAIVRDAVNGEGMQFLGFATKDYEIITNIDIARALDKLTPKWPVETFGVLQRGSTVFFTLKVGSGNIGGSNIERFFLVTDTRDGGTALRFMYTPLRVECQNMLNMALSGSSVKASLQHRAGAGREFSFRMDLLAKLQESITQGDEAMAQMTLSVLTDEAAQLVFMAAFPDPKKPAGALLHEDIEAEDEGLRELRERSLQAAKDFEYMLNRQAQHRWNLTELYNKFNDEYVDQARTPWAAYNAVCEYADHRDGGGSRFESAMLGQRAKEKTRAFTAAMEFAG